MSSSIVNKKRKHFGVAADQGPSVPYLVKAQIDSYEQLLQQDVLPENRTDSGIQEVFKSNFPVVSTNGNVTVRFLAYHIDYPANNPIECKSIGSTYSGSMKISLELLVHEEGVDYVKQQEVYIGDVPFMTDNATFVINGSERIIVSQLHRSAGLFFEMVPVDPFKVYTARIIPTKGAWLDFEVDERQQVYALINKKKISASTFLMALVDDDPTKSDREKVLSLFCDYFEFIKEGDHYLLKLDKENISRFQGKRITFDLLKENKKDIFCYSDSIIQDLKANQKLYVSASALTKFDLYSEVSLDEKVLGEPSDVITPKFLDSLPNGFSIKVIDRDSVYGRQMVNAIKHGKCSTKTDALIKVYSVIRPNEQVKISSTKGIIETTFMNESRYNLSATGRLKLNQKLGIDISSQALTQEDIILIIKKLLLVANGHEKYDDPDSLEFRRVRSVGELVKNQFQQSINKLARAIQDRISTVTKETNILELINARHFISTIREFFGTSQLSQLADQTNLLSELSHKRRLSSFGPGGLERSRPWIEVRDLHPTHYGKICAIETPEGTAIGLVNSLTIYAQIDEHGFLKTPYRPVKKGVILDEMVYLGAAQEAEKTIAHYDSSIFSPDGKKIKPGFVHCRFNNDHILADAMEVDYVDISPKQILSISSSLIPFVENDDATRAVLGANMQRQALPLVNPTAPLIGTGMEKIVARDSGSCVKARHDGVVEYVSTDKIIVRTSNPENIFDKYELIKLSKSNDSTMINQSPCVSVGESIKEGDFIALGTGIQEGEVALGRNVRIAFLSWKGCNYEDAIIISSRMTKQFAFIGLTKFEISTREIKQGIEQFTRDIPNINTEFINQLDDSGIVNIGTQVKAGDILVGRVTPKGETNMTPDERLLRAIFGDKSIDVKDTSLRVPPGMHGTVIDVKVFTRKGIDKNRRALEINQSNIKKYTAERDLELNMLDKSFTIMAKTLILSGGKVKEADIETWKVKEFLEYKTNLKDYQACVHSYKNNKLKLTNEFNEKCKKLIDGDILPVGVLETVQVFIATEYIIQTGDKIAGRHGNKGIISKVMAPENMPYTKDGEIVDMLFTSVGISGRMNIGQVLETHLGWASINLAKQINNFLEKAQEEQIYVKRIREFLLEIYDDPREQVMLKEKDDDQILEFARSLEHGIPFACPVFEGPSRQKIKSLLELAGCDPSGKEELWDGETGLKFPQKVSVGVMYVMQLHHLVEKKEHARSVGPYSIITQQPLGGRAQMGGQRFGEMEIWALQAYAAAYTARETLTVKSDYPIGRSRIFELIGQGYDLFDKGGVPEAFAVLLYELRALCLNVECMIFKDGEFIPQELIGIETFDALKISIASPSQIRAWSYGEVVKPETIHYRTSRPHPEGIFSTKIFGPIKDYQCLCGKHKGTKRKGIICSKCGTEVTTSKVRRYRMGHIELASPVAHIWFTKVLPSRIAIILDMSIMNLNKLLKFENYAVITSGLSPYSVGQVLNEQEYREALNNYEDNGFEAYTGTEALEALLKSIDIEKEIHTIRDTLPTSKEGQKIKMIRRLKILESFHKNGTKPEHMILRVIPVLPPDLRPLVAIEGGRFASSDFNDLYRRIINRNNRLSKLLKYSTPGIIIRNEKRMLQEAVDGLFDNSRRSQPITNNANKRPLKSLADTIKGKQGRFRQNLLGKRVDYSGRSVIIVGPNLKLYQCGLPKSMALELFKPFVLARLVLRGFAPTLRIAKTLIENKQAEVWDILSEVTKNYVVLINRAPTLHRLGIQAFEPILIEGRAIQLHPLTCKAFNADFDGDQVGVHIPLSIESQIEARLLMMSTKCIINPSNGIPIATPAKDIVLGLYAMTCIERGFGNENLIVSDLDEAEHALSQGIIRYTTPIKMVLDGKIYDTTYGRLKLYSVTPRHPALPFEMINTTMSSKEVQELVYVVYINAGEEATSKFLDEIMRLGFYHATMCGATFSYSDLPVPDEKVQLIEDTNKMIADYQRQFMNGLIREDERHNKLTAAWSKCADTIAGKLMDKLAEEKDGQMMNPVWMIAVSGARGSPLQLRQLAAMRGLIARQDGSVQESPIVNSFIEGMNVREYILAARGARKGLSDIALKTANSGYLTRRLADTALDCITKIEDCGTNKYIDLRSLTKSGNTLLSLGTRAFGRTLAEDIYDNDGNIIGHTGTVIDVALKEKIDELEMITVKIRSPATCDYSGSGICCTCYGYDLSSLKPVKKHVAVGVIAAQSIGEPGTQLTMKNFQSGGAAQNILSDSRIAAMSSGSVRLPNIKTAEFEGNQVVISRNNLIDLLDNRDRRISSHRIPYGAYINVKDKQKLKKDDLIASWDPYILPILAEKSGKVTFHDLVKDVTYREVFDYNTGLLKYIVKQSTDRFSPSLILEADGQKFEYHVQANDSIEVENGAEVMAGQMLVQRTQNIVKTQDIIGGLPLVGDLFEARTPKNLCIMSDIDGRVEVIRANTNKVVIHGESTKKEYNIPGNVNIIVDSGDEIKAGDHLTDGRPSMHDILNLKGPEDMTTTFIDEIQNVYQMQGIFIGDKHIEIILRQMLGSAVILDPGQTALLRGDIIRLDRIKRFNEELSNSGKSLITFKSVLNGISKAAISEKTSFFAAASFQGPTQRLTEAVILNEKDPLSGMKEALITGQLIPAGIGGLIHEVQAEKRKAIEDSVLEAAIKDQIV